MKSYGVTNQVTHNSKIDYHLENLKIRGYSIQPSLLSHSQCDEYTRHLNEVYAVQENEFGKENLSKISDLNIARMPFVDRKVFFELFMHQYVLEIAEKVLGKNFQLHLQNGIINPPSNEHHQTSWHRDLPYQDWVISKPLGFNAFWCLSDFTTSNGATYVLPYSHRSEHFPSNQFIVENEVQIVAPKGSILFFDSMLFHRAGHNSSSQARIGVNNMFVVPIIKQQINIPHAVSQNLALGSLSKMELAVLGFDYQLAGSVQDFRTIRINR